MTNIEVCREHIDNVAELEKDQCDINSKAIKKFDDYKEAYMHLNNADEALENKAKDFDNWLDGLSGAIDNCGKDISDIRRIVNSSEYGTHGNSRGDKFDGD